MTRERQWYHDIAVLVENGTSRAKTDSCQSCLTIPHALLRRPRLVGEESPSQQVCSHQTLTNTVDSSHPFPNRRLDRNRHHAGHPAYESHQGGQQRPESHRPSL